MPRTITLPLSFAAFFKVSIFFCTVIFLKCCRFSIKRPSTIWWPRGVTTDNIFSKSRQTEPFVKQSVVLSSRVTAKLKFHSVAGGYQEFSSLTVNKKKSIKK